jgi:hypothetical protein
MFQYSDKDFIFTTSWKSLDGQSKFDEKLRNLWREKEDQELFRYKYYIECSIELPGKYGFLAVVSFFIMNFIINYLDGLAIII